MPVVDKNQWPCIGGFPSVLESNACGRNYGAIIIKHYQCVLKPSQFFLSASSERKALPIFDGCPSHLNIDLLKELGGYGMIVLIHMTNTSHETNMKDLVSFGIAET